MRTIPQQDRLGKAVGSLGWFHSWCCFKQQFSHPQETLSHTISRTYLDMHLCTNLLRFQPDLENPLVGWSLPLTSPGLGSCP